LSPTNIDTWNHDNSSALSEAQLAALKSISLTTELNNPGRDELEAREKHPKSGVEIEGLNTPMSKAARDLYDGRYQVVISDMQMPANNLTNDARFDSGGVQMAKIAQLANVPCISYTRSSRGSVEADMAEVTGRRLRKPPILYVEKEDQGGLYRVLSNAILERTKAQQVAEVHSI
jgi:hypothetical protein